MINFRKLQTNHKVILNCKNFELISYLKHYISNKYYLTIKRPRQYNLLLYIYSKIEKNIKDWSKLIIIKT